MKSNYILADFLICNTKHVEPVKAVLNAIGWEVARRISLESFFT